MKRVGIYSGIFDPIHNGHIGFAHTAAQELELDKVFFIVEARPRRKQNPSDIEHRLQMLQQALTDYDELELLPTDHQQLTVSDTLPWLQQKFTNTELYLLMGTDLFQHVHTWPDFKNLEGQVQIIVGQRDGESSKDSTVAHYRVHGTVADGSSSRVRAASPQEVAALVPKAVAQYIDTHQLYR